VTVYLVGAGPGDPGLVTMRGADLLARADAVVYDRLVHPSLLALAPASAELHDVGKRPGGRVSQEGINELLVELGRRFGVVVRLKGGDPFVFGRGGEEALALSSAHLAFEVVPGVSAVNGVPAYAGIPLTHRGLSTAFTVVTGHGADGTASGGPVPVDWDALAKVGGTIVILMGVEHRAEISERLIAAGRKPSEAVAVIENGTLTSQRTTRTTLGALGDVDAGTPSTVVVGEVAALDLAWFSARPLLGWRVAITRTREQASQLSLALAEAGAEAIEIPTIAVVDPADGGVALRKAVAHLSSYTWVVFTSTNAVGRLFAEIADARAFGSARVAAIGDGAARALESRGIVADLMPGQFVSEALAEAFPRPVAGEPVQRVLLPRAAVARDVLPLALAGKGYEVDIVETYRTVRPEPAAGVLEAVRSADAVTFTSSSTVTGWLELFGREQIPPVVGCIGPITAATAREAGIAVDFEATEHSIAGLVAALVAHAGTTGRPSR
jgi:uroporphyrinogen III methyltransferase/synthase